MDFSDETWLARERQAIERTRRGDVAAFAALYEAMAGPLFQRVLLPRLGRRDVAEEALGETFRLALERLGAYADRGASIFAWLATIAANVAMDVHRREARGSRALANLESLLGPLASPEVVLDERAERARLEAQTHAVLAQINERYRRAIALRFFEARERADCAELMQVKLGTFDVLLLRALRAFREAWLQAVGEPPELS